MSSQSKRIQVKLFRADRTCWYWNMADHANQFLATLDADDVISVEHTILKNKGDEEPTESIFITYKEEAPDYE